MRHATRFGLALLLFVNGCSERSDSISDSGSKDSGVADSGPDANPDTESSEDEVTDTDTDTESGEGEVECNGSYCYNLNLYCECMLGKGCGSTHTGVKECVEKEALFEKVCMDDFSDFIACRLGCCQSGQGCQDISGCFIDNQCSTICL